MQPASAKEVPVDGLCAAVERQASLSMHLGAFMQLIVKLDDANMRTVRDSWERHGRPAPLLDAGTSAGARTRVFRRALERTRTRDKRALGARSLGVRAMR